MWRSLGPSSSCMPLVTVMLVSGSTPRRILGPERSCIMVMGRPSSASTSRMHLIIVTKSAAPPCEKLRRNTLTPASANSRSFSLLLEAGPIVATIFVLISVPLAETDGAMAQVINRQFRLEANSLGFPAYCQGIRLKCLKTVRLLPTVAGSFVWQVRGL